MQSGRVPFRVQDSRKFVLGSLAGHVGITLLFSMLGAALLEPPPPLTLVKVNLQTFELPREKPRAEPEREVVPPLPRPEPVVEKPRPEPVVEEPKPAPPKPQEVKATKPEVKPDTAVKEEAPVTPEPTAPDFELPREAQAVPEVVPEDVDFLEPAAVQPEADRSPEVKEPASAAQPEEVAEGAIVQATASEGVDDFYLTRVQMKIGRLWRPTDAGTRGARDVKCVVSFRIGPQGAVISPTVTTSSGFSVFDRRALAAVEGSAPLPAPPTRFGDAGVEIDFHFSYSR